MPTVLCKDGSNRLGGWSKLCDSTTRKVVLQGSVESLVRDQALKTSQPSTTAKEVSGHDRCFCSTGPGLQRLICPRPMAFPLLSFPAQFLCTSQKVLGQWGRSKVTGGGNYCFPAPIVINHAVLESVTHKSITDELCKSATSSSKPMDNQGGRNRGSGQPIISPLSYSQ